MGLFYCINEGQLPEQLPWESKGNLYLKDGLP